MQARHEHRFAKQSDASGDASLDLVGTDALLRDLGGLLLVQLGLDDAALLRGIGATDEGGVAVEVLCDFLERRVLGLDVELEDEGEFDREPDALWRRNVRMRCEKWGVRRLT